MSKSKVNMAIATGNKTQEGSGFKLYQGIAPFYIKGVNLTKAELLKLFPDRNIENEPKYTFTDDNNVNGIYITLQLMIDKDHPSANGVTDLTPRASYPLKNAPAVNRDGTKVQVINKYGHSVWITNEEFAAKTLPDYAVKQAFSMEGMRVAFVGEADLMEMIKSYLGIMEYRSYTKEKGWFIREGNLNDCECQFSEAEIKKLIAGEVGFLWNILRYQPDNKKKYLVGVRTTDTGKEYQEVCTRINIRFGDNKYDRVQKDLQNLKDNGSYGNTDFGSYPFILKEYNVQATSFEQTAQSAPPTDPFAAFAQ